jgi:hypothetical protein
MSMLRKLSLVLVVALLLATLLTWWGSRARPILPGTPQHAGSVPAIDPASSPATLRPVDATAPGEEGELLPTHNRGKVQQAGDAAARDDQIPAIPADLPPELSALLGTIMKEVAAGNYDHAALIALDAEELSADYPQVQLLLLSSIARNYENLGYLDMAIEQYRRALALDPGHAPSYNALRRLDPEFEAIHPELGSPATDVKSPSPR